MRFKKYIKEMSFEEKDVPRTFRVVFEINQYDIARTTKAVKQLSNMKLEGLTGISDKSDIGFHWLGVARDAMLIMKGNEVIKLNKVSRFLYGNPNYFLSNKMAMAKRIFQKGSGTMGDSNLLHNILEYMFKAMGTSGKISKHDVDYTAAYQTYSHVAYKKNTGINSSKDLVKWIRKAGEVLRKEDAESDWGNYNLMNIVTQFEELSDKDIEDGIYKAFELIGNTYGSEGEWVIKNDYLKVPKGSYLYILAPKKAYKEMEKLKTKDFTSWNIKKQFGHLEFMDKWDALIELFEKYGIFKKYVVKFIDNTEWKRVQSMHLSKR